MSNVIWTQAALDDLSGIKDYIARDSTYYADKFVDEVFNTVEQLEVLPRSGRMVPERYSPDFREITHGSYRIIYRIIDDDVYIVTMIHGRRNYQPD